MMKFFRKYNKQLLALFMVLLMIVFLGGNALYELAAPSVDRTIATSRVGDISIFDQAQAKNVTDLLSGIGLGWQQPVPGNYPPLTETDWVLLTREAVQFGVGNNEPAVRVALAANLPLDDLSRNIGVRKDRIVAAIAQLNAIQQLAMMIGDAATVSEAEILSAAETHLKKVRVNAVALPAKTFEKPEAEFTEEQIQEQYEKHRTAEPGPGLQFGYYVPPKLKIQYVKIDVEKLAEVVRVSGLEKKARAYYDERPEQPAFKRPVDSPDEAPADPETPSTSKSPYLSWEEAKEIAMDSVRRREAAQTATRIADWLIKTTADLWYGVEKGADGYIPAPVAAADPAHYENLFKHIPATIAYPQALQVGTTDFVSRTEVDQLPQIGTAVYRGDAGAFTFKSLSTLAFLSKPIVDQVPEEAGSAGGDYLALHQTSRYPLTDFEGHVYVFRVVDHHPGHIPESLDEVRDRVVDDLRLIKGYENAKWRAESLRACEDAANLQEAFEKDDELVAWAGTERGAGLGYFEPPPFSLVSRFDAVRGKTPELVYMGPGVGSVPFAVAEGCFAMGGDAGKIEVFELPDRATLLVVEWVESVPAKGEEFMDMRDSFTQQMARTRSQALIEQWLNPEQIRARNQFAIVTAN